MEDRSVLGRAAAPPDETISYGPGADHLADIRHGTDGASRPLVVFVHGGFWRPEFDRQHAGPLAGSLATHGWTVASIEYRRIPGQPDDTVADVSLAMREIPQRLDDHRGEVIVVGHSAGGHLALWTGHNRRQLGLAGVVALAPVADLCLAHERGLGDGAVADFLGAPPTERPDLDPKLLEATTTPVTIVHGERDTIVPVEVSHSYAADHPGSRLVVVDDAAHFEVIDPASVAFAVVVAELERLGATG